MALKQLYFKFPIYLIAHYALKLLSILGGKVIVYGYRNTKTGKFLKMTRIASTAIITDIDNLEIADNVWVNHYSRIDASGGVSIGEGCQVGFGSCILSHSSNNAIRFMGLHYMASSIDERIGYIHKSVKIGAYTFIGGGSYILPGVTIGKGCVIGVNSVVNKDVPDYSIVVGSPARIIGSTKDFDNEYMKNHNAPFYYDK